jgi:hypothetical protein
MHLKHLVEFMSVQIVAAVEAILYLIFWVLIVFRLAVLRLAGCC